MARQYWQEWQAAPSVEKIASFINEGDQKKKRLTLNQVYANVVDELRPFKIVTEAAEKAKGRPIKEIESPYALAWLLRGWARKAENFLKFQPFQWDTREGVKFEGKPLKEICLGTI